jgi:predicted small metal-binding protein
MKILLTCPECDYQASSWSEKELMNKIIMWNHVKKAHARTAERIMRSYQTMPNNLYGVQRVVTAAF